MEKPKPMFVRNRVVGRSIILPLLLIPSWAPCYSCSAQSAMLEVTVNDASGRMKVRYYGAGAEGECKWQQHK